MVVTRSRRGGKKTPPQPTEQPPSRRSSRKRKVKRPFEPSEDEDTNEKTGAIKRNLGSTNVGLSAKMFQLTATSFFAAPVKFGDLRLSLSALGLEQLRDLLAKNGVFRCTESMDAETQVESINRRFIREAKALELAGFEGESKAAERAYFQGLLRGVGALGVWERFEDNADCDEFQATDFLLSMWGIEIDSADLSPVAMTTMEGVDRVITAIDSLAGSS